MRAVDWRGKPLAVGDRVQFFRTLQAVEDAAGAGGMPGVVQEMGGPAGRVLFKHDEGTSYAPPYDVRQEWAEPRTLVKVSEKGEA